MKYLDTPLVYGAIMAFDARNMCWSREIKSLGDIDQWLIDGCDYDD